MYYRTIRISKAERIQDEFDGIYGSSKLYKPQKKKYIESRKDLLMNAYKFYRAR